MSETTGPAKVHEAYSFACMRCGHGWEQSYEIEHHVDPAGQEFVVYTSDGQRVPSPLSSPTCLNCGGHVVRIMREGRVSSVRNMMGLTETGTTPAGSASAVSPVSPAGPPRAEELPGTQAEPSAGSTAPPPSGSTMDGSTMDGAGTDEATADRAGTEPAGDERHWHLSDLLHPFQHRK
ncbi:hypothetical protein [Streptomyces sp. NPDC003023]|uniref:hypothetical protein n=1 Tax=Streptomyces sp. NPDC003023 TaxID=3364675 RepID=UPI0036787388